MHELAHYTITQLAEALRSKSASSRQATELCLRQLERLQPVLHLGVRIDAGAARRAADASDLRRARGEELGPLDGVPLAHKDLFDRVGLPTTCGSRLRSDHVARRTASVLQRLEAAGAVDLGSLNMAEFAAGGSGHNPHWGDCLNPWNREYSPGGSSSGSAAAVAARAVYGSLATDTGGSLRWPAALCGVTALRPTLGRVSLAGVAPRAWSLDAVGPVARSAQDCALLLAAIAGPDPDDPASSALPVADYVAEAQRPLTGVRLGVPGGRWRADLPDETHAALEESLEVFHGMGTTIVELDVPDPEAAFRLGDLVVRAEAASLHGTWLRERPAEYAPAVRAQLESGLAITAAQYLDALRLRGPLLAQFLAAAFESADVLHLPVHPFPAPKMSDLQSDPAAVARFWAAYPRLTRPLSFLGLPVLALPCGISRAGVPIGMQLVAPPFNEGRILNAGQQYQSVTDWHARAPLLSSPA